MSTALHAPIPQFYSAYQPPPVDYRSNTSSNNNGLARLALNNNYHTSTHDSRSNLPTPQTYDASVASQSSPSMSDTQRSARKAANWNEFYKNGLPKEVIVIEDSPEPAPRQKREATPSQSLPRAAYTNGRTDHTDKRRRVENGIAYDPVHPQQNASRKAAQAVNSTSASGDSRDRTTSALYSTAPTSLGSSIGSNNGRKVEDAQAGQKRKLQARAGAEEADEAEEIEILAQSNAFLPYVPPAKPPIKAAEVYVQVVRDKATPSAQKMDDEDGHYIVSPQADFTDRYKIVKLLGQGTFGKVIEAFDNLRRTKCAVKIIRAVPKYRDASRIELRVLKTLASNDKYNRNKCIHLRDCFDFRNHICIVTDLLSSSVFDFLKSNSFVPFPSSQIQSFARQLLTSVAFLHDLNLIHTDLKPENILLVSDNYQTFTYNRAIPSSTKSDTKQARLRRVLLNPEIRLIDFGSATFDDEYHSSVVSTRHYRAPEIILNLGWSFPCDIWSIGCILVEFFTGDALFQTHDNLEHLAMMEAVCDAKIDKDIIDKVRSRAGSTKNTAAAYFRQRAYGLNYPNNETHRNSKRYVKNMKRLCEIIPSNTEFNRKFLDLLRRIFVYDPRKRITAKQALAHPWFKEVLQDDGTEALKIRLTKERAAFR